MKLVMACCCVELTPPQREQCIELAERVQDWGTVISHARKHFVAPLVARHLKPLPTVPEAVKEQLARLEHKQLKKSLLMLSEIKQLNAFFRADQPVIYFKGLGFSSRFYGHISLRKCRDIDLLMPKEAIAELVPRLLQAGYKLSGMPAGLERSSQKLRRFCLLVPVVCVISPRGVMIEIHRRIDWLQALFPIPDNCLFAHAETERIGDVAIPVLNDRWLIIHLFSHHSKHFWSQLFWITDVSLLMQHPGIDWEEIKQTACQFGLETQLSSGMLIANKLFGTPIPAPMARDQAFLGYGLSYANESLQRLARYGSADESRHWTNPVSQMLWTWRLQNRWRYKLRLLRWILSPTPLDFEFCSVHEKFVFLYYLVRPVRWTCNLSRALLGRKSG